MLLTIDNLINLLKEDGINSKKQVIDLLENASIKDLRMLQDDCKQRIIERNLNDVLVTGIYPGTLFNL